MAKITGLCVGESLVGEGNEVAHLDLIMKSPSYRFTLRDGRCLSVDPLDPPEVGSLD